MNERALQDAYRLFQLKGYQGEIEDFVNLLNTNTNALSDSYTLFTRAGYTGTVEDFSTLLGLKKKDETQITPEPVPEVVMDFPSQAGLSGLPKTKTSRRVPTQAQLESPGEQETWLSKTFGKIPIVGEVIDTVEDMATYVQQGLVQGSTLDEALEVMARGSGSSPEDIAEYIEAVKQMDNVEVTDEMRDFAKIYQEGGSNIGSFLWGIANRPSVVPGIILQSFANYINPTAVAGGAAGVGVGAGTGAALTPYLAGAGAGPGAVYGGLMGLTGTLESGLSFTEFLKEEVANKGLEFDEAGVAAVLNDEEALSRVRTRTAGRGATISVINAFTAGVAGQVQRAGRKLTKAGRNLRRIGVEMTGGGVGEAAGRKVAGQEMDVAEIGFEAIGEIGSPETVIPILKSKYKTELEQNQQSNKIAEYKINEEVVTKEDIQDVIQVGDLEALQNINIEIINDPELQANLTLAHQDALIASSIKQVIPNITSQDLKKLVTLQKQLTGLEENTSQVAKDKIPEVKNEIKLIEEKYAVQEPSTEKVDAQKPTPDGETVGEGDTQQQPITGETTSEQTQEAQSAEEVTTEVEDDAFSIKVPSQKEQIIELLQTEKTLSNKQAADKLGILEANVRRIFGVGTKEGVFERVTTTNPETNVVEEIPGVYTLKTPDNKNFGVIETADALTSLPKLVKDGFKFDFIYLDPPYKADSGNRNIAAFPAMTDQEFGQMVDSLKDLTVNDNAPILLQYTQSQQAPNNLQRLNYFKSLYKAGFKLAGDISEITYIPTDQTGKEAKLGGRTRRADIMIFTKSGKLNINDLSVNLSQEQGQYVVRVPVASRGKQIKKKDPKTGKIKTTYEYTGRTRKPPELLEILIEGLTEEGQAVLDPTAGTGSTLEAAVALGRDFYGIEIMEETAAMARKNVEKAAAKVKKPKAPEKKAPEKKAPEKKAPEKKEPKDKPTPPKKTIKKPEVEPKSTEVQEAVESITPLLDRVTAPNIIKNLENIPSLAKTYLRKPGGVTQGAKNVPLEKVRSTPQIYFDQALGINNSVAVYDNTIGRIAKALGVYEGNFDKVAFEVSELEKKLGKLVMGDKTISKVTSIAGVDRMRNKQLEDALLIGVYMDVRQAELNQIAPGEFSDTSPNPVATLDMSIKRSAAPEARTLQKFKDKYVKDGKIKSDDILKDFSPTQKSVLKSLDKLNAKLEPLAIEVLKRDGKVLNPIKGYFHRLVLPEDGTAERVTIEKNASDFADPSKRKFRSDALIERTEGNKPINYNPFISLLRGSQQMLLDYHVSPELDIVQDIAEELRAKYSKGNKGQKDATVALDLAIKENLRTLYLLTYMGANDMNLSKAFMAELNRNMYRAMLSSGPRFASELLGNAMMFITQEPKIIKDAYTKYRPLTMNMKNRNKYKDVLLNLQSAEVRKVAKRSRATNRALDVNDYLNLGQSSKQVMSGSVFEKIEQLLKFGPKQSYKAIAKTGDFLMAGADKLVTTPVWVSKFAFEFKKAVKKYNKEDVDVSLKEFDKIADGTSEFLGSKYKKARDEAVRRADRMVASFVTSGNPINAIIKNRRRTFGAATSRMDYYRHLNSFMANFNLNEYASARFAVGALLKSGYMSKPEAAKQLGGILARMSSYVILYRLLGNFMDELFGAPEEEEDPLEQQIARQLIGSSATLLFRGGIGNIWALPINMMIESLNKQYLEELRDGKPYDAFDNSIVYSLISLDVLNDRKGPLPALARILSGRYAPLYQVGERSFTLVQRMFTRKTEAARKRAAEELLDRMISIEVPGLLGLLPFYKDARRVWLKKKFGESDSSSNTSSGFDPFNLEERYRTK